jgi:hypothetical protein
MRQTVKSFWQDVNWENRPAPVLAVQPETNGKATISQLPSPSLSFTFDMKMSVRDYLNAIPWSGAPIIAASEPAAVFDDDKYKIDTLDDFLEDISKFF